MHTQSTGNGRGDLAGTALAMADTEPPRNWPTNAATAWDHERGKLRAAVEADDLTEIRRASDALRRIRANWAGDTPEEAPGVQVMSWTEMQALPPLTYIVDDLLPEGGVSLVVGHPKAGKSTLARVLASEVAGYGEGQFLGRDIINGGRVLYYSPDEAPQMTVEHLRGILPTDANKIDFVQSGDLDALGEVIEAGGHSLLIVDTLGRLFQAERFPDGDSYMAWQTHLDRVRRSASGTGCHICLLHHARKSGGERSLSVLGSAAIAGSADTVISLTVTEDEADGYVRHVESVNRAGVELPRQRLALKGDGWLTVAPTRRSPEAEAKADVKAMRRDGISFGQIAEQLGISKNKAFRWAS